MDLSKQVCTLEQAKKLKELGVDQQSYIAWCPDGDEWFLSRSSPNGDDGYSIEPNELSAYTVAELGIMVPNMAMLEYKVDDFFDEYMKDVPDKEREGKFWSSLFTPVFLADLLIYLLENNHTTPEEVNTRLKNS